MKTVEERIKDLKKLAMIYLFLGIVWAVFLIVAEKTGWVNFRGDVSEYKGYGMTYDSICFLNDADFKLPYKVNNYLSAKDGVFTEVVAADNWDSVGMDDFRLDYENVDDNLMIFHDHIEERYFLMEKDGKVLFVSPYRISTYYYEDYGLFSLSGYALIDKEGNRVLKEEWYDEVGIWDGKIIVKTNDYPNKRYGLYDLNGNCIVKPVCVDMKHGEGWFYFKYPDGNYRLLDGEGNDVEIKGGFKDLEYVSCDKEGLPKHYFIVQDNEGKWYTCDEKGNEYISERYDELVSGDENIGKVGILIAEKDGKKGIVNALNGEVILDINYKSLQVYQINKDEEDPNYIIGVTTMDDKVGIVSSDNEVIVEPNYKDVSFFCAIRGKDNKPQDCLFKVTTTDNMVGMVTMNKGIAVEPAYKDIDIVFNTSKEQKNSSYAKYAYILTTMDDKIGIYTEEDGFFAEPTDLINEKGEYYYFDERDVACFDSKESNIKVVIPKGKVPFTIKNPYGLKFHKEYIEVHETFDDSYYLTYDGEKYNG
ncbi:MAG: hypothetical protein VZR06_09400 [Butyrivibrio sp.]|nr:hypothetical protein [Butyrivibrio sp.]